VFWVRDAFDQFNPVGQEPTRFDIHQQSRLRLTEKGIIGERQRIFHQEGGG